MRATMKFTARSESDETERAVESQNFNPRSGLVHFVAIILSLVTVAFGFGLQASAAVKKVPYPEVKVEIAEIYKPDAAFEAMLKSFAGAVAKKDTQALFALVGPTFVWTVEGALTDWLDLGRNALHNFKVAFGFRALGVDVDGAVENGPFWDALAAFAQDNTYYKATDSGNRICGPIGAIIADEDVFERVRNKIETANDQADWYFTLGDTSVAKAPGDRGAPVAKVGKVALPVLSTVPAAQEGKPASPPMFLEVLLPSGKTGWIPASAARPLVAERLCYANTAAGEWKIVAYDQYE